MDKIGFKRSKDINSHSFYEAQEKMREKLKKIEKKQVDNGTKEREMEKNEKNVGGQWEKNEYIQCGLPKSCKIFFVYM